MYLLIIKYCEGLVFKQIWKYREGGQAMEAWAGIHGPGSLNGFASQSVLNWISLLH